MPPLKSESAPKPPVQQGHPLGQSVATLTIIITVLVVLAIGTSLSLFNQQSAQRSLSSKKALQSYFVAMQGVQEALGNRMVPRTNQLNFIGLATPGLGSRDAGLPIWPFYPYSGRVFDMPVSGGAYNPATGVYDVAVLNNVQPADMFGVYRYIVVGGDSATSGTDGAYNNPAPPTPNPLIETVTLPGTSPYYILSSGITCINPGGLAVPGALTINEYPARPTCRAGTTLDETVVVARARIEQPRLLADGTPDPMGNMFPDQLLAVDTYRNNQPGASAVICLAKNKNQNGNLCAAPGPAGQGALVPGVGFVNSAANPRFNFETAWGTRNTAAISRVVFYNTSDKTVIASIAPGDTVPAGTRIPSNATIRLFFTGPVDFRSLYNYNIQACVDGTPDRCNIQLRDAAGTLKGINFVPIMPGNTSVVITPSFTPNRTHCLRVLNLRAFNGDLSPVDAGGANNCTATFTTR